MPAKYNLGSVLNLILQLRNIIAKNEIDLLHLHTARAGYLVAYLLYGYL